jgi:NTP pyrophosphatase (non-canonical NTP hydrolase)
MDVNQLAASLEILSKQYAQRYQIDRTGQWLMLKLMEEVGELTQVFLKQSGQTRDIRTEGDAKCAFENELADVLGMTLLVAREFDLDIDAGLQRKWFSHQTANEAAIAGRNPGNA